LTANGGVERNGRSEKAVAFEAGDIPFQRKFGGAPAKPYGRGKYSTPPFSE